MPFSHNSPEKSTFCWMCGSPLPMAMMMSCFRSAASRAASCSLGMNANGLQAYTLASEYPPVMPVMSYVPLIPMIRCTRCGLRIPMLIA